MYDFQYNFQYTVIDGRISRINHANGLTSLVQTMSKEFCKSEWPGRDASILLALRQIFPNITWYAGFEDVFSYLLPATKENIVSIDKNLNRLMNEFKKHWVIPAVLENGLYKVQQMSFREAVVPV